MRRVKSFLLSGNGEGHSIRTIHVTFGDYIVVTFCGAEPMRSKNFLKISVGKGVYPEAIYIHFSSLINDDMLA